MKNKKITFILLVSILLFSFTATGCGKNVTAQECAKVSWDMNVNHNISDSSTLNINEKEAKTTVDSDINQAKGALKQSFTVAQIKFTDSQIQDICDALLDAYSKVNVKIEEVSNDGVKAQIKYTTTYFDMAALNEKATSDAVSAVEIAGITDETEVINRYSELYIQNLINEFKNVTISTDTKEKTYTFVRKEKVWLPEDTTNFGTSLCQLITNQI